MSVKQEKKSCIRCKSCLMWSSYVVNRKFFLGAKVFGFSISLRQSCVYLANLWRKGMEKVFALRLSSSNMSDAKKYQKVRNVAKIRAIRLQMHQLWVSPNGFHVILVDFPEFSFLFFFELAKSGYFQRARFCVT